MANILISDKIDPVCPRLLTGAGHAVDLRPGLAPADLLAIIGGYDGLVVRSATKVTAEVIARGSRLKIVGRAGAGLDTIDVGAAKKAGVAVVNTPGQNANGVAELALGLMLALVRHIDRASATLKNGVWAKNQLAGTELLGKTLGVVGYGAVGGRLGQKARALGMEVLAYDPLLPPDKIKAAGAKPVALDELYRESDFVSLHLPKTPETVNMVSAGTLAQMKPGAYLLNCARGGLVDEAALAAALTSGHLAGAAMDVFAQEPVGADNPLLKLDNFIGTPHLGASTAESQVNVARDVAERLIAFFKA